MTPEHRMASYYGYAFESYCTVEDPSESRNGDGWGGRVDTNVQWCAVTKSKMADLRIVVGGEVDCVRGKQCIPPVYLANAPFRRVHWSAGHVR